MMARSLLASILGLVFVGTIAAKETLVHDVAEFDAAIKAAGPGDEIVLADGEWRDAKLVVRGKGEPLKPITIRARTPGTTVFVGSSSLRIGGEHLEVRDLLWKDCEAESEVIAFRIDSKTHASNCSLKECAVIGDAPAKGDRKWVSLYGQENRVESCRFDGKQSAGTLLVVWLPEDGREDGPGNGHSIAGNFFGPREKLGKNGGEIIRVGDSKTSMQRSNTYVDRNCFYHCDGEAEIVSNKSCENCYRNNFFVGCGGALTLRHGNRCVVSENLFFGDGRKGTGGVRIIGEGHSVAKNLFHGLEGDGGRAAVSLMNGIPNSPPNGYFAAKHAALSRNVWIDCKQSVVIGLADKDRKDQRVPPSDCTMEQNIVFTKGRPVFASNQSSAISTSSRNVYHGGNLGVDSAIGWSAVDSIPSFDLRIHRLQIEGTAEQPTVVIDARAVATGWQLNEAGPRWMKPGDEYLPAVLKASAGTTGK